MPSVIMIVLTMTMAMLAMLMTTMFIRSMAMLTIVIMLVLLRLAWRRLILSSLSHCHLLEDLLVLLLKVVHVTDEVALFHLNLQFDLFEICQRNHSLLKRSEDIAHFQLYLILPLSKPINLFCYFRRGLKWRWIWWLNNLRLRNWLLRADIYLIIEHHI